MLSDTPLATYAFKTIRGFEHAYVWKTETASEADPEQVDLAMPKSALPPASGSLGSRLIKSTIQEQRRGRQRPGNFARAYRTGLRCA